MANKFLICYCGRGHLLFNRTAHNHFAAARTGDDEVTGKGVFHFLPRELNI
jgi:hypothetical protein